MEKIYLQELSPADKATFHQQELFDNLREIKLHLSAIAIGGTIIETVQNFLLPSDITKSTTRATIILAVGYVLACICYYISIFKYFERKSQKMLQIRYWILIVGVICYCTGVLIGFTDADQSLIHEQNPKRCLFNVIEQFSGNWLILLIDMLFPFWYIKLMMPIAHWILMIIQFYRYDTGYYAYLWTKFAINILLLAYLFKLKAHVQWKTFSKNLNIEMWYEVQKSILNKVPDCIAVIGSDSTIIYSNSSFHALCNNNLTKLGQELTQIHKLSITKIEREKNETWQDRIITPREETGYLFATKETTYRQETVRQKDYYGTFNELLTDITASLQRGTLQADDYLSYTGKYKDQEFSEDDEVSYGIKISPILNHKKIIVILTETTEREKVIFLQAVNQHKDKLLAAVSHDLRAPINGSLTFIGQTLDHEAVPLPLKHQYLIPAQRSLQFLLHLVNDILDFSQINAQKLRLTFENQSIINTIKNCFQLLETQASHKKIDFSLELDKNLPETFATDHNRVSQIIINLLTNAIKFTFTQGKVKLIATLISNMIIEIKVIDTGIGIKEEDQTKLFKDFTRIDYNQPEINQRGVGLGLVIGDQLARMLGPDDEKSAGIKLCSVYGEGSTFSFLLENKGDASPKYTKTNVNHSLELRADSNIDKDCSIEHRSEDFRTFPLDTLINFPNYTTYNIRHPDMSTGSHGFWSVKQQATGQRKVLVVDDDSFNILALESLLQKYGVSVDSAFNGEEAIEKIKQLVRQRPIVAQNGKKLLESNEDQNKGGYHLIFMDCEMPIMNGFQSTEILKEMMNKNQIAQIPIIGCTGHIEEETEQMCKQSGMIDVITKPIMREKLDKCLQKYLKPYKK